MGSLVWALMGPGPQWAPLVLALMGLPILGPNGLPSLAPNGPRALMGPPGLSPNEPPYSGP